jgi:hypothetical protein
MPLKHMLTVLKGAIVVGTFVLSQAVKLQLKHLMIVRVAQGFLGLANSLTIVAECSKVHFMWVLEHKGIEVNEIADKLARMGFYTHLWDLDLPAGRPQWSGGQHASHGTYCCGFRPSQGWWIFMSD